MDTRSIFKSKTILVNAVVLIASFFPAVSDWVTAHPAEVLQGISAAGILLRLVTNGKVTLVKE